MDILQLVFQLIVILVISGIFGYLAKRLHLSAVIGLIVAGIIITSSFHEVLISEHGYLYSILSRFGLFSLMFLSGLEISWNIIYKEEKHSLVVTLLTILTSFVLGSTVIYMLGYDFHTALIMGTCFGITAEASKARVLIQLKKINTKIGALLMGTGITNDIFGIGIFFVLVYFFTNNITFTEVQILSLSLVCFVLGMYVHYVFDRYTKIIKKIEKILLFCVVPFFFVDMGIVFNENVSEVKVLVLIVVVSVSMLGQMLGVFLAGLLINLRPKQLYLLGWGMNAKGAVELAIASMAFDLKLVPADLYSALLITVLISTVSFQVIIFKMVKKDPKVMD